MNERIKNPGATGSTTEPMVYNYLDYRKFIRDFLAEKKREATHFSQRYIHQKMGVSVSSGFIANVIKGKKNLSRAQIVALARIFKLSRAESMFFEQLVAYNQAKNAEEKTEYLNRIMRKQRTKLKKLAPSQLTLFSQWHYVFIRELLAFYPVSDNFSEVAALLQPSIKPDQVREALETLSACGLIRKDSNGRYIQDTDFITTGNELKSAHLFHFQLQMIDLAKKALHDIQAKERDISVVSFALSNEGFKKAKAAAQEFRKTLLCIAEEDSDVSRVYHCNVQLFPMTRPVPPKGRKG